MGKDATTKQENKTKGFLARLVERLDRKMKEKAKEGSYCCSGQKSSDNPCCK